MFESLSDRLQNVFARLGARGRLSEADVDEALKEVRRALLEADVNFKVVKDFVARVREQAVGQDITKSLTPAQMVVKIVHDELVHLLGDEPVPLAYAQPGPTVILLVGLNGAGKTTLAGKLALFLRKKHRNPLLVACDVYRPAAIKQLQTLGNQIQVPVYSEGTEVAPAVIARNGVAEARRNGHGVVIIDTAGRFQIDEALMQELEEIRAAINPHETLLVVDAMIGQESVRVAEEFNRRVPLTGFVMTKIDGDARGGAALSIRQVTGVPIKFLGTSEKLDGLQPFDPARLASRILGMGDVLTLIERAEEAIDKEEAARMQKKMQKGKFDFEDFLNAMKQMRRMGPLQQLLSLLPGMGGLKLEEHVREEDLKRVEAIILSMTPEERRNPDIIKQSRKERIARGSGTDIQDVNELLRQFRDMQRMMKTMMRGMPGSAPTNNKGGSGKKGKKKKHRPTPAGPRPGWPGLGPGAGLGPNSSPQEIEQLLRNMRKER
ncbi:signal recognition particle protein [Kallotenue papyrolyticum]|uniref:signal recognition particle protein n=1 Tax=Kallotenue papyrolyticum TaxID=1325125 RepID=UPI000492ACC3|nr:signal recognition particle protein [Kallotenue papyrolyticum]